MKTLKIIFRWIAFLLFMSLILVSCEKPEDDVTPPERAYYFFPRDGAVDVSVHTEISVRYNEYVIADKVNFFLRETETSTAIEAEVSVDRDPGFPHGSNIILTPTDSLKYDTEYTAYLVGIVSDLAGNTVREDCSWSFTTIRSWELIPPEVVSVSPKDGSDNVSIDTKVIVEFSEPVIANASNLQLATWGRDYWETEISTEGNKYILTPVEPLRYNTVYLVFVDDEITDLAGNALANPGTRSAFTTEIGPWGLPKKYTVWSIGTNDNDEIFMGGDVKEADLVYDYFLAKFNNQGEFLWLKEFDTPSSPPRGPTMTVTNDFIYLGTGQGLNCVDELNCSAYDWRIDKYTVNGEKIWSSQPDWNVGAVYYGAIFESRFRIIPAEDGNLYARDGQTVYKLSSEGRLISQVDCQRFYVSTMESTPYDYLLLFGQYSNSKTLAQLTYSDFSWRGVTTFPSGTHMRLDGNSLFLAGQWKVSKHELVEDGVNNEWSIKYNPGSEYYRVQHTDVDRDGNLYVLVESSGYEGYEWIKISPNGEIKARENVKRDDDAAFFPARIAVTHNKVFVNINFVDRWVFDLETGTVEKIY